MNILDTLGTLAAAAAFAEAGESEKALRLMHERTSGRNIVVAYESTAAERDVMKAALPIADRLNSTLHFTHIQHCPFEQDVKEIELEDGSFNQVFHEEVENLHIPAGKITATKTTIFEEFYVAVNKICSEVADLQFVILQSSSGDSTKLQLDVPYFFLSKA